MAKIKDFLLQREEPMVEFPDNEQHYVAYVGTKCDIYSKVGGYACVIAHNGETFAEKKQILTGTTCNRLGIAAIIEAIQLCPGDALLDIYTNNLSSIQSLRKTQKPEANGDLWLSFQNSLIYIDGMRLRFENNYGDNKFHQRVVELVREAAYEARSLK